MVVLREFENGDGDDDGVVVDGYSKDLQGNDGDGNL